MDRKRIAEKAQNALGEVEELQSLLEMVISRASDSDGFHDDDIEIPARVAIRTLNSVTHYINDLNCEFESESE